MKTLPLLVVLLLTMRTLSAQETSEPADWTTEQRCISAPSQPPVDWTYDGVIFTLKHGDGVHARRADVPTRYYVAFDSESEFGSVGSFSPDGKWFALPHGAHWEEYRTSLDNQYWIVQLRVYSTTPAREMYSLNWHWNVATYGTEIGIVPLWLDNQHILYPSGVDVGGPLVEWVTLNPFTGETDSYRLARPPTLGERALVFGVPPEFVPLDPPVMRYFPTFISLSSDKQHFAFIRMGTLQVGNVATRQIVDTCIHPEFSSFAFSPDGHQLAFGLESAGYVYILDIPAWEAYRIDLAAADVIGWYPLE